MDICKFFVVIWCVLPNHLAAAKIDSACFSGPWESCYITIEGPIDRDTPTQFANSRSQLEGGTVLLNSDGGDSMAAITLGRMIRDAGLSTEVEIEIEQYNTWANATNGFVELQLDRTDMPDIATLIAFVVRYDVGRVGGGTHIAHRELTEMDRHMMSAVLRNCI